MADPFDLYKAMMGVDIAQVEMVGEVVGKAQAAFVRGLADSGLSDDQIQMVVKEVWSAIMYALANFPGPGKS